MDDPLHFSDLPNSLLDIPDDQFDDLGEGLDEDLCHFYRKWGFNIYRTAYGGPHSDREWEALVKKTCTDIRLQMEGRFGYENIEEVESRKKLLSLFLLSLHSTPNSKAQI
ncbi:uncharacterized protein CTRU02_204477 [Colletotrichum truncatum]|uniref:Uncharacterized protein n=1 Tax=Colletotrichum truncatum TaxID=5467 RepID=A0ACC3ZC71_COLTU